VVIEEDGKTEEEFIAGILQINEEYTLLNQQAQSLNSVISKNLKALCGE